MSTKQAVVCDRCQETFLRELPDSRLRPTDILHTEEPPPHWIGMVMLTKPDHATVIYHYCPPCATKFEEFRDGQVTNGTGSHPDVRSVRAGGEGAEPRAGGCPNERDRGEDVIRSDR